MLNTLKELCALNGVSSWEDPVRDYLRAACAPYAASMTTDALGNLIVRRAGRRRTAGPVMLTAPMDEAGIMVKSATEEGYLKFGCVGPVDRRVLIGKRLSIGPRGVPGIVGLKAYHLVDREEEKRTPKVEELYLDIGARSREEALSLVSPGDVGAFVSPFEPFGRGLLKGKALDSRACCALLLTLLRGELPMDCTFVFTAQEKVGGRGALGAAFSVAPAVALVLNGAPASGLGGPAGPDLGAGPAIAAQDNRALYDRALFEDLRRLAEEGNIPWQLGRPAPAPAAGTALQGTRGGVRVCGLSLPVRSMDAPSGVVSTGDLEHLSRLTGLLLERLAAEL